MIRFESGVQKTGYISVLILVLFIWCEFSWYGRIILLMGIYRGQQNRNVKVA